MKPIGLDLTGVYAGLKDFQRDTVDYVFDRLYGGGSESTSRFLVADEVGLGKTLVARGLIAKTIEHLERDVRRIDVVYVCSNAEIARQNIRRLNVTGRDDFALASRITLLPTVLHQLSRNRLNFVSFTPGTSLDLKSTGGIARERALLHRLLSDAWGPAPLKPIGARRVFQGSVASDRNFRWYLRDVADAPLDPGLVRKFAKAIEQHDRAAARRGGVEFEDWGFRDQFDDLRDRFRRERKHRPPEDLDDRRSFIGALREQLAHVCLNALEPDLVILDEFQRFKHLLRTDEPAGELAQQLFAFRDNRGEPARVVLLSATPYKMYTISEDIDDDHYVDLVDTLRFLFDDEAETEAFKRDVENYRQALFHLDHAQLARVENCRNALEKRLRRVVVRTERLSTTPDRDGMLCERRPEGVRLEVPELESYARIDGLSQSLDAGDVLEYWKSAPYLLTFMDGYKLSNSVDRMEESLPGDQFASLLAGQRSLRWDDVEQYRQINAENPRLRSLITEVLDIEAWRLLWVPPSLPYYALGAPFDSERLRDFTKRLVFSAWTVVPKAIASLVSYEAERRMLGRTASRTTYSESRTRLKPLLRFSRSAGRDLPGLPVLGLLYPSPVLADLGDPFKIANGFSADLKVSDVLAIVEERIREKIAGWLTAAPTEGRVDEKWYWATPFLLDQAEDPDGTTGDWLRRPNVSAVWTGSDERGEDFAQHVDRVRWVTVESLGRPPDDLIQILAQLAVAGPGVTALRALARVADGDDALHREAVRDSAARVAWAFRSLFNLPEVTALVRKPKAYWKAVLDYCTAGCLQAVLDEYAHVLVEWLGLTDREPDEVAERLAETMYNTIALRTASYDIRDFDSDRESATRRSLRARLALRFGDNRLVEDREAQRPTLVREAFNSPFWPFVLATTSVGQEGLDFHLYCHAVVHWNLPANPVDLEQREGRVHRYKGHAIRKNLAATYPESAFAAKDGDPWQALFAEGKDRRKPGDNDLVPSWVFTHGPARIERLVPTLPLSRDESRLVALKRSLAAYRLAFGQPRQEELVAFLGRRLDEKELSELSEELRIDLSPVPAEGDDTGR